MHYYGTHLSENISRREPEGYLLCLNVPVARTGTQEYLPEELGLPPTAAKPPGMISVFRPEDEVFSPATIASFEGMPVTNNHPPDGVDIGNIRALQKGHAHNVRRGTGEESDLLLADLIITDPTLIDLILQRIGDGSKFSLMDDYMFTQVMRDTRHLKSLLGFILKIHIARIALIEPQKTEKEGYLSKGVRLDLYVTDETGTVYSVDVQTSDKKNVPKRMRYYQSTIVVHILHPGVDYRELRKTFVIFICNYDPYNKGRVIYTFENICREDLDLVFGDETVKVIVNTKGTVGEITPELREVIQYLDSGAVTGSYSQELAKAVSAVKANEERRLEYMTMAIHEMEIREEGREEGCAEGLEEGRAEGLEKGLEEGLERGQENEKVSGIRRLMKKLSMTMDGAMDFMDIPEEDCPRYAILLKEDPAGDFE